MRTLNATKMLQYTIAPTTTASAKAAVSAWLSPASTVTEVSTVAGSTRAIVAAEATAIFTKRMRRRAIGFVNK